jgi:D-lactate dehydrogenase (cytochrome)
MLKNNAIRSLKDVLAQGQVFTDAASLISYEVDAGLDGGKPEGVVFPHNAGDIVRVMRWAIRHNVPLVARGAGTGLSGGAVAERGGVIVEFSRMNHILDIDAHGRSAVAEPGLINLWLDEQVKQQGLYFPPDPASQRASTIGGNVAENSGGPHCFKYGVTTNYVIGMNVVLSEGRLVRVGGRALDYPEYDLTGLITGSEGMLALMAAIDVRLVRNPPAVKTMLAVFDSVEQAGIAVSAVIAAGLVPATMEMMDQKIIRVVEEFAHIGLPVEAGAMLIVEVDGYAASLDSQMEEISTILLANGGSGLHIARSDEERNQIWFARKSAAGAMARLAPSCYTVDITVPRSHLAETLGEVNAICDRYGLRVGYVFHAGDGNLHPLVLTDYQDKALMERVHDAGREMVEVAINKGGSLSGEHGVGIEKRAFMSLMHNSDELATMLDIKQAFDPNALLNPGKIFPVPEPDAIDDSDTPTVKMKNIRLPRAKRFAPANAEEAAGRFIALAKAGRAVSIRGTSDVGAQFVAPSQGTILSTEQLHGVKTYAPDDLYITVGAGTPLADIQAFLAPDGKWVPIVSPWPSATIGGIIATNLNAPLRMRYGAIRDLVLCATVVLPNGRIIRTGRPVIKNVAGYDLTKVFIGSHGTLGLITDVTLKLAIQPRTRRTLLLPVENREQGLLWARKLLPLTLVASALVFYKNTRSAEMPENISAPYVLAYTVEGVAADVEAELAEVRQAIQAMKGPEPIEVDAPAGSDIWAAMVRNTSDMLQVRVGVPPKDLPAYMNDHARLLNKGIFLADMSNGLLYTMQAAEHEQEAEQWLAQLRQPAQALEGYAVVAHVPKSWQTTLDRWGHAPQAIDVMQRLKARWDPQGILNPGEFLYSSSSSQAVPNAVSLS